MRRSPKALAANEPVGDLPSACLHAPPAISNRPREAMQKALLPRRKKQGRKRANDRTRTGDLSLTRGLLYQLSYVGG